MWIILEHIMLSERSQAQRSLMVGLHFYDISRLGKFRETESRWVSRAWGRGRWEVAAY